MDQPKRLEQFNFKHRLYNALQFTAFSQEQAVQLDRLHGIRYISLFLSASVTTTGTATALTTPTFVQDLRLTAGGGTVLWAGSWHDLALINQYTYGVTNKFSNLVNGGAGTYAYKAHAVIDLQSVFGRVPIDTALISRLFSSLELRARIGAGTDMQTGATTIVLNSCTIEATLADVVNMQVGGSFIKRVSFQERQMTATSPEFVISLPTGNQIKRIYVMSRVAGVLNDTVINNLKVLVGGEVLFDERTFNLQGEQILQNGVNTEVGGLYVIDFNPDKILSEGANLAKVASLGANLVLDCTLNGGGTNLIRVYTEEQLALAS